MHFVQRSGEETAFFEFEYVHEPETEAEVGEGEGEGTHGCGVECGWEVWLN